MTDPTWTVDEDNDLVHPHGGIGWCRPIVEGEATAEAWADLVRCVRDAERVRDMRDYRSAYVSVIDCAEDVIATGMDRDDMAIQIARKLADAGLLIDEDDEP